GGDGEVVAAGGIRDAAGDTAAVAWRPWRSRLPATGTSIHIWHRIWRTCLSAFRSESPGLPNSQIDGDLSRTSPKIARQPDFISGRIRIKRTIDGLNNSRPIAIDRNSRAAVE